MKTLMSCPGLLGDITWAAPIAYEYWYQTGNQVDWCSPSCFKAIKPLFEREPWCNEVLFEDNVADHATKSGMLSFWVDKVASPETEARYNRVYHLGFKECPQKHLTLAQCEDGGVPINVGSLLYRKCFSYPIAKPPVRSLCLHLASREVWKVQEAKNTVWRVFDQIMDTFDEIHLLGIPSEAHMYDAFQGISKCKLFYGNLVEVSELLARSVFIGAPSSMAALVNGIKSRGVVLMPIRPAGCLAQDLMTRCSNHGEYQVTMWANETDRLVDVLTQLTKE